MPTARPLQRNAVTPFRPGASPLALLVFAVGATTPVMLNVVGELFLGEVLAIVLAAAILFSSGGWHLLGQRPFVAMFMAFVVMLIGYMISDLVVGSRPDQYLRGWGRVLLVITDFMAYFVIFARDRRLLWWLVFGMGLGGIAYLYAQGVPLTRWKLGYAEQSVLVVLALNCYVPGRFKVLPIAAFCLLSMWLDYRSFAAFCLVVAGYLWLVSGRRGIPAMTNGNIAKIAMFGVATFAVIYGLLLATSDDKSLDRRAQSDAGRLAATEIGFIAIARSPFFGYGSWPEDAELANLQRKLEREKAGDVKLIQSSGKLFGAHNQLLNAWVEGGLLAASFFFFLLYRLAATGLWITLRRSPDLLSPIMIYFIIITGWNALMSPFAGVHRVAIGIGAAILVVAESERRRGRRSVRAPLGQRGLSSPPRNSTYPPAMTLPHR